VGFFRGKQAETSVWRRFRSGHEGFTFVKEGDHFSAHVVTNAERTLELFRQLMGYLPPAVDVAVDDRRARHKWSGTGVALSAVQDAIGIVSAGLVKTGGIEVAVYTTDDQLTLNPQLELFIYARSDRWLYLLVGAGLEERTFVPTRSWKFSRRDFGPAPELSEALAAMATRLGLHSG